MSKIQFVKKLTFNIFHPFHDDLENMNGFRGYLEFEQLQINSCSQTHTSSIILSSFEQSYFSIDICCPLWAIKVLLNIFLALAALPLFLLLSCSNKSH